jgi:hypothetical protein
VYRCGPKPIPIPGKNEGDPPIMIQPGEIVPGTESWPRLEAWERARRIVRA